LESCVAKFELWGHLRCWLKLGQIILIATVSQIVNTRKSLYSINSVHPNNSIYARYESTSDVPADDAWRWE
jgi:hypothetical protein